MTRLLLGAAAALTAACLALWLRLDAVAADRARLAAALEAAQDAARIQRAATERWSAEAAAARARADASAEGERAALARVARLRRGGDATGAAEAAADFLERAR